MARRILLTGLLGAVTLLAWTILVNVGFGFTARIEMNSPPNERAVYDLLKEQVERPGAYLANPALTTGGEFPPGEPVFGIRYGGVGHEAAGRLLVLELVIALVSSVLVAGLLSLSSARILSRYWYRVLFVAMIGLLLAVHGDLARYGIGGYPAGDALLLALNQIVSWALAGVVMAWSLRERQGTAPADSTPAGFPRSKPGGDLLRSRACP